MIVHFACLLYDAACHASATCASLFFMSTPSACDSFVIYVCLLAKKKKKCHCSSICLLLFSSFFLLLSYAVKRARRCHFSVRFEHVATLRLLCALLLDLFRTEKRQRRATVERNELEKSEKLRKNVASLLPPAGCQQKQPQRIGELEIAERGKEKGGRGRKTLIKTKKIQNKKRG